MAIVLYDGLLDKVMVKIASLLSVLYTLFSENWALAARLLGRPGSKLPVCIIYCTCTYIIQYTVYTHSIYICIHILYILYSIQYIYMHTKFR